MTQLQKYLYAAGNVAAPKKALIILPEIYGVQDFMRELAHSAQAELGWTSYVLDHFFAVTGKVQTFDYSDPSPGMKIMQQMTGEVYLSLLDKALRDIRARQPELERIAVWGFCFGGKLAYLSGANHSITDIISFYGGASLAPDFNAGRSVIEALATERAHDRNLRILAAFGEYDEMIPAADVSEIHNQLDQAEIHADVRMYSAGHAFYNEDRLDRYDELAAKKAWDDVKCFLA